MNPTKLCFMTDIESLALDPNCLITVIAITPFAPDHSWVGESTKYNLNGRQQRNRTIDFDTILWWFEQDDAAIKSMAHSMRSGLNSELIDMLLALVQDVRAKMDEFDADDKSTEFWFRGPQFDAVAIESLIKSTGLKAPWRYDMVMDLRTLMRSGGVDVNDVNPSRNYIKHDAADDTLFQIDCHAEAIRN